MSSRLPSAADSVAVDVRSSTAACSGERGSSAGAAPGPGRDWPRVPSLPWCPIVFAIVCAGLAVMRVVVLMRGGAPATVDSGNWLAFGHALLGSHVRSSTIVYPPVVPLILTSVSSVFGARVAVGLVGAVSSLAPGAAVYWVLRRSELRWSAVALAVLVTAAGSTGESTAWGGFPQLLGLGGMVVALWLLDEWLTEPTRRRGLAVGGALLFVGATSDIAFGATLVCAVLVVGLRTLAGADTVNRASRTLRTLPYVVLPMVPLVPLYSRLIQATRQTGPDHVGAKLTLSEVPSAVEFLYRDLPWPWRLALVSAVVAPLLFADRWRDRLWIVATSLLATASVTTIVLHEDRFLYLLPLGVALGLGLWARELAWAPLPFMRRFRPALAAALAVFVVAQIVTGAHAFGAAARLLRHSRSGQHRGDRMDLPQHAARRADRGADRARCTPRLVGGGTGAAPEPPGLGVAVAELPRRGPPGAAGERRVHRELPERRHDRESEARRSRLRAGAARFGDRRSGAPAGVRAAAPATGRVPEPHHLRVARRLAERAPARACGSSGAAVRIPSTPIEKLPRTVCDPRTRPRIAGVIKRTFCAGSNGPKCTDRHRNIEMIATSVPIRRRPTPMIKPRSNVRVRRTRRMRRASGRMPRLSA